ncbi:MAG: TrkH family potassium uptake protein [Treponema sp.]|nr:TrkH family potassium uptake protein [Treponema sp.]
MFASVLKIISVVLAIVGLTFIIPILVALSCAEWTVVPAFLIPMLASLAFASVVLILTRRKGQHLSIRASFSVVMLAWTCSSLLGAVPLYFSGSVPDVTSAVFESISGFTTTGATNIEDIEALPRSINLWRCQTHWLGGMGIVALTVALLPILGVGGFQLIKAETTGPDKGKFTPKITTTAKVLWFIYLGMTVLHVLLLKLAGMDLVDSLAHAFSSMGTGGFSMRAASIAAYESPAIDAICSAFMFLSGINFTLFFYLFTGKLSEIRKDTELKVYVTVVLAAGLLVTLVETEAFGSFWESFRYSFFQVISIITTTGYGTWDYTMFKPASQMVIFILFLIGGCAGSTGGGFKVIRWTVLAKQLHNEIQRMLHPHGIFTIRINDMPGRKDIVYNVAAFFFLYIVLILLVAFAACLAGLDIFTSLTGSLSMVGNVGPAFGLLGPSYSCASLPALAKWAFCLAMLAGRLEFYTMVIYFFPSYWKK